jgi:hypothetical protein
MAVTFYFYVQAVFRCIIMYTGIQECTVIPGLDSYTTTPWKRIRERSYTSVILNPRSRWWWAVSFTSQPFPHLPLPHICTEGFVRPRVCLDVIENRKNPLPPLWIEPSHFGLPARSLAALPTQLLYPTYIPTHKLYCTMLKKVGHQLNNEKHNQTSKKPKITETNAASVAAVP